MTQDITACTDPGLPDKLEWNSIHYCGSIRGVYDGTEDLELRFMIFAA